MATSLQQYDKCIAWRENITKRLNIIPIYDCKFSEEWELGSRLLRFPAVPGLKTSEHHYIVLSIDETLHLPALRRSKVRAIELIGYFDVFRHEEDGVQDSPVAREVLLLRRVQNTHWDQELHPTRAGDLLRWMLWGEVRHSLREVQ